MKIIRGFYSLLILTLLSLQAHASKSPEQIIKSSLDQIALLQLPQLNLSYKENLNAIGPYESLQEQEKTFKSIQTELQRLQEDQLTQSLRLDKHLIQYQVSLNLERLSLEKQWHSIDQPQISEHGLAQTSMGKHWYSYFLKRWVDITATPEKMMTFGQQEVKRVSAKLLNAQHAVENPTSEAPLSLNDKRFFLNTKQEVHNAFEQEKTFINKQAAQCFPLIDKIPDIKINAGTNQRLAQTPGYYRNNQFSYNYFDKPFNVRQVAWLYLHEAIPGHHYQISLEAELNKSPVQAYFIYPAYREGWAAYVEDLGTECGFYDEPLDELGKWEWDIVRSVRIVLDVGLNYYDWSDQKAFAYWQKYIKNRDDIAHREIARMKRWPAQVITYKYGANALLELKDKLGIDTSAKLKKHHENLLLIGPLPFSLLTKIVAKA